MKVTTYIQFNEVNVVSEDLAKVVKEELKNKGIKMVSVTTLDLYYKPEETTVYYVAKTKEDEELTGSVAV